MDFNEYVDQQPDSFFEPLPSITDELIELERSEINETENFIEGEIEQDDHKITELQDEPIIETVTTEPIECTEHSEGLNHSDTQQSMPPFVNQLTNHFSILDDKMENLKKDFETKLMIDEQKDKVIDNLHRELQFYKNHEMQDRILPLVRDLIGLIDNLEKQFVSFKEKDFENPERLLTAFKYTAQDVEDILYRQGIEALPIEDGKFDSKRHKVLKTVKTTDKEKDRQIAQVFNKGFVWDQRIIRQELVAVYVYEEEASTSEE